MWRLETPNTEDSSINITKALTYANGDAVHPISTPQRARILELYNEYDANSGNPHNSLKGEDVCPNLLNAIKSSYSQVQKGGRLEDFRNRIKLSADSCPYCGFGPITDLDHHLPNSSYKAHAIYAKNLIPSCHPCNNLKRAKAGDSPLSQFSHVYFGQRPIEPFLTAEITVSNKGIMVIYNIKKTADLHQDEFERLSYQFDTLELNKRYIAQINLFLGSQRTAIEEYASISADALKYFLRKSYENLVKDFGPNHWQTVLLKALSESDNFCGGGYVHCFGRKNLAI